MRPNFFIPYSIPFSISLQNRHFPIPFWKILPLLVQVVLVVLFTTSPTVLNAQTKTETGVAGTVVDENDRPLMGASVQVLGRTSYILTDSSGTFFVKAAAGKAFALVFSFTGRQTLQKNFLLQNGERDSVTIRLMPTGAVLETVVVNNNPSRYQPGLVQLNPKNALVLPSPVGGIESLIKLLVGSNNELSSQYSVRGGNYDENIVYINDIEVYRPYLVRSGQQEGLSFINPEMVRNVQFYMGGFAAKYGDRMSSVLDIQYKQPAQSGGSAYISLLEQGLHLEGSSKSGNFSWLAGVRNRNNRNVLAAQETQGNYVPGSNDVQTFLTWKLKRNWTLQGTGILSATSFDFQPTFSQQTTSVFSSFFTANLGLDVFFDGQEKDRYQTRIGGITAIKRLSETDQIKFTLSSLQNLEEEKIDITGAYIFGDRSFDRSSPEFGTITNPLGAGRYQQYARNYLSIVNHSMGAKGEHKRGKQVILWGLQVERTEINDRLNEWELQDSAGYSLPYAPGQLSLQKVVKSNNQININRIQGYIQDNILVSDSGQFTVQAGLRFNYNDLNQQLLLSPRVQAFWHPDWKKDFVWKASVGAYHQPPFYREMRRPSGSVNRGIGAQKSWQLTTGFDHQFLWKNRPFRWTAEAYFKSMTDVVTYDQDNVKIRYAGENNARAYATGLEMRLFGEFVKDAESWISVGFMRTRENLEGDRYYNYTLNDRNEPVDSVLVEGGWFRRPTDRLLTVGLFFQDYLSTNQNFKMHMSILGGSNMPYNIPNSVQYRNGLKIEPYMRVDLGLSVMLLNPEKSLRRSKSPFRNFKDIWLSAEIFNLIDRANTISYQLVKDFENNVFAIPNRLTPRLFNLKLVTHW